MQVMSHDEFRAFHESYLQHAGELQDNRFAVIASKLYELTDYNDISTIDGEAVAGPHWRTLSESDRAAINVRHYSVVTILDAPECWNISHVEPERFKDEKIITAFVFEGEDRSPATEFFKTLIANALASF